MPITAPSARASIESTTDPSAADLDGASRSQELKKSPNREKIRQMLLIFFFIRFLLFISRLPIQEIALVESEIQVQTEYQLPASRIGRVVDTRRKIGPSHRRNFGIISTVVGPQCHIVAGHIKAE